MFVPPQRPAVSNEALKRLVELLHRRNVVVLSGAGLSTESGIPDYRSAAQRERVRRPIQHQEFVKRAEVRARYWARSLLGWPRFAKFSPNAAHAAVAQLEDAGLVPAVLTQNVDRLHHKAGSCQVLELHGALERVRCLACGASLHRDELQVQLDELNPGFAEAFAPELLPDGDANLPSDVAHSFRVPDCARCGGMLKPDVVFFGDNVPPSLVRDAFARVEAAQALLVVGSSLHVYSGYRFVLRASERRIPIAIVNAGETRADELATVRIDGLVTDVLPRAAAAVAGGEVRRVSPGS